MDALTKEEREVVDWVRATSASKALKWSQEPGEWINRAELLLETVDRLTARLALADLVIEAGHSARQIESELAEFNLRRENQDPYRLLNRRDAILTKYLDLYAAYDKGA